MESIRGEGAQTRFAEVTFTHETWAKINSEMDNKFSKLSIVGWYHTHPDFGIFLSDRDRFIHEHFFTGPGQIAHVIDPIRKTEGVFIWRDAKPSPCEHYWVGDRILAPTEGGSDRSADLEARPAIPRDDRRQAARLAPAAAGNRRQRIIPRVVPWLRAFDCVCARLLPGLPSGELTFGMGTSTVRGERAG